MCNCRRTPQPPVTSAQLDPGGQVAAADAAAQNAQSASNAITNAGGTGSQRG